MSDLNDPPVEKTRKRRLRSSGAGRATLEDLAEKAGVSAITVSRAFRQPHKVSATVRDQINRIADELGYVSNRAASTLASSKSMTIAALVPSLANMVFGDIITGIDQVLKPAGYQMLMGVTNYSPIEEEKLINTFLSFNPDGILLTGINYRESTRRLLQRQNIPIVHMMELSEMPDLHCVGFSQEAAAQTMTDHLLSRGKRRIAFVAAQLDPRAVARNRGYRETLQRAGLFSPKRELMVPDPSSVQLGGELLDRLLIQAPDVDAVFFCNDDLAQGALFECHRRRIRVPDDIAVAGFNDLPASAWTIPALTTIATPRFDIGKKSARMLISLIEGNLVPSAHLDLGFSLKVRESA